MYDMPISGINAATMAMPSAKASLRLPAKVHRFDQKWGILGVRYVASC